MKTGTALFTEIVAETIAENIAVDLPPRVVRNLRRGLAAAFHIATPPEMKEFLQGLARAIDENAADLERD